MTGNQDAFQQAMNQGHSAAWDQLWDRAAQFYRLALEEMPNHPQALMNLGLALYELEDYEGALNYYKQAARVSPEDPLPVEKIAQLHERLGNLDQSSLASLQAAELYIKAHDVNKAIENWQRVTRLNPENIQAHSRLALVYERLGNKSQAVSEYLVVASLLQSAGNLEKAIRAINQALQVMPNNPEALQALTLVKDFKPLPKPERPRGGTAPLRMSQVRQLEAPEAPAQMEAGLDPVSQARQKALTILAGLLFDSGDDESDQAGRRALKAIVSGTGGLPKNVDRTRILLHLGQAVDAQTRGQSSQAADELERAIDAGLTIPAAYFDLGFLLAESGRLESSVRQLQFAVKGLDFSLGAHLLMASLLRKREQLREAAVEYMEALRIADALIVPEEQALDLRQLYEPLIEACRQQSDTAVLNRLCANIDDLLMRQDWRDHLLAARAQLPIRDPKAPPIPLAEIITEARGGQVIDSISLIYELAQRQNYRAAMEESYFALQFAPTYLPLHSYMGELLLKQDDISAAVAKFFTVAKTYSIRGETDQSITFYRRIKELTPMDLNIRTRLIDQEVASGQFGNALGEYMELAGVYFSLADLDMTRKTYTEALRLAQQPGVDRSWRIKIMHRMADMNEQSMDWRQALRIYEQIRTLQPDDEKARLGLFELNLRLGQEQAALSELDNYLAYLNSSQKIDKAVALMENLANEYPERIPIRRRLADLYRHLGKKEQAVSQLDAIGDLLMETGDRNGAIQTIEMILALNPSNRDEYQRVLEQIRRG